MALLLSKDDVSNLISMEETIPIVESVYAGHGEGRVIMPAKITLDLGESGGWPNYNAYLNSMPAYIGDYDAAGVKIIGGFFDNSKRKLPSIMGVVLLVDPRTGAALSILEASLITALRTGASTAVGVKHLARKNSSRVTIFGAGLQARYQLKALSKTMDMEQVYITDINSTAAQSLSSEVSKEFPDTSFEVLPSNSSKIYEESDIIITVTSSHEPIVHGSRLQGGTLLAALGSYKELDDDCVTRASKIVIDSLEQAKHRGSLTKWLERENEISSKVSEISNIVIGKSPGRQSESEIILYEPIGLGSTDVAVAHKVYQSALSSGKGKIFDFL